MTLDASLDLVVYSFARDFVEEAEAAGVLIEVTSGYRSLAEQARLYAKGRTTAGPRVTGAKPGYSWHNHGLAVDVAPLDDSGEPHWPNDVPLWKTLGTIGKSVGFEWGGDWRRPDYPHFQVRGDLTIGQAIKGARPSLTDLTLIMPPPRNLARGMVGEDVRLMQSLLATKGDGDFGPKSQRSLKGWQKARRIPQTGTFKTRERAVVAALADRIEAIA